MEASRIPAVEYDYSKSNFISQFQQPSIHINSHNDSGITDSRLPTDHPKSKNLVSQFDQSNQASSIFSGSQMTSKLIFGKYDEEKARKEQEQQTRLERIKAVRLQESMASANTVKTYNQKQQAAREQEEQEKQYQEYLAKLAEIEKLKKKKEQQLQMVGKAHQEAEALKKKQLEEQLRKQEQLIAEERQRKTRGAQALVRER